MAGRSGLEIAPLLQLGAPPAIVFLTAHRQYAIETFDVQAVDYLLKPVDENRLEAALVRVEQYISFRDVLSSTLQLKRGMGNPSYAERIAVTDRRRTRMVRLSDVEWIGAAGSH
jgi:two-component system LytT family response regulator